MKTSEKCPIFHVEFQPRLQLWINWGRFDVMFHVWYFLAKFQQSFETIWEQIKKYYQKYQSSMSWF